MLFRSHLFSYNEVWSFGDEAFEICRKYMNLREQLRPYIREQMKLTHEKGTPVMRPLFYDFSQDENTWNVDDSYMFGPDLLVSPVMEEDASERKVYLPAGYSWKEAYTQKVYDGGQWVNAAAPIDVIPVFVKEGSDLIITF